MDEDPPSGTEPAASASGEGLTRRDFMMGVIGAGFALAIQPVTAGTMIVTDSRGLVAGGIGVPARDGIVPAYRAVPAGGGPHPVILVVHEIFGVHEHIQDVCRRLAKLGYLAVAPDLFAREGDVSKLGGIDQILAVVGRVPDRQVMGDLDACVEWAKDHGGDTSRLGVTGFCWGGRITWLYAAHQPLVKAAVAWYGKLEAPRTPLQPVQPVDIATHLHAPVLGLYGGQDQSIPPETVERMRAAIRAANGRSMIHVYPDAPHAFYADYRPSYRKDAADDGWKRLQRWFRDNGV